MKSKRVLIVDDNDLNRKLFENLIGHLFSYDSVKNGLEAVEMATTQSFDLILMDIQMPVMDGITAMKRIRRQRPSICPILAVTAYADETHRSNFLAEGFDDFITKPIRPQEFLKLIQDYLLHKNGSSLPSGVDPAAPTLVDRKILDQLLKYNSKQAIHQIFEEFLLECSETESLVDSYSQDADSGDLLKKIHTLKGNSGTLGIMGVFYAIKKAEELERNEKYPEFEEELKKLKKEIRLFRDFFHRELIFES